MQYLPILLVFVLYFSSIPIAYALFGASIFYFTFFDAGMPPDLVLQKFITATASFPLLAIPFFVLAGSVMNYSGISSKLMQMAEVLTGHMVGGLAQVNVLLSTMMGGVSGSANADAAMQSKILVPQMEQRGYSRAFSAATTAASSAISPVIPPGIKWAMLVILNALLLFIGMFLEGGAALIIVAPLLVPVVVALGVDTVHFGMIIIVNIMLGGVTPPFGSMMFTTCSVAKVPVADFVKEVWPFILALLFALLIVSYFPTLIMFFPNMM